MATGWKGRTRRCSKRDREVGGGSATLSEEMLLAKPEM